MIKVHIDCLKGKSLDWALVEAMHGKTERVDDGWQVYDIRGGYIGMIPLGDAPVENGKLFEVQDNPAMCWTLACACRIQLIPVGEDAWLLKLDELDVICKDYDEIPDKMAKMVIKNFLCRGWIEIPAELVDIPCEHQET